MAKDTSTGHGDPDYPLTTWGTGEGSQAMSNPAGSGKTLDARKRQAPPVGADVGRRKKQSKAPSSITPW